MLTKKEKGQTNAIVRTAHSIYSAVNSKQKKYTFYVNIVMVKLSIKAIVASVDLWVF